LVHWYFAYGSNMSRLRLQERTGAVIHHGRALLQGYTHHFTHRGRDGSGKGNIEPAPGRAVHGVLYELSDDQVLRLESYEGGYEVRQVELALIRPGWRVSAYTYVSEITQGLRPLPSYVEHYYSGMAENDFPSAYFEIIRRQART
jgi:cation transport regulator ChaC